MAELLLGAAPMDLETSGSRRSDREILDATRPFARDDPWRSWGHVVLTFALLAGAAWCAVRAPWLPLRVAASVVEGLTLVRAFILFHDHLHGAILRGSLVARALFGAYGMLILTPPRAWRDSHNYHHAHNGKIVGSHVGSYPIVTPTMWARMTRGQRLAYRAARHPATIAAGYLTVFAWGMCLGPFLRAPRKNAAGLVALAVQPLLAWAVVRALGWEAYGLAVLGPEALAMATGAYLFYAQHNFVGARFQPRESWSYVRAALESSSYMETGPVLRFFTGNIGYHHVHHLNPAIPFYRLPEAMAAIPELRAPVTTHLRPKEIAACLALDVWDPAREELVAQEV
jgi:omega-6 fatty acid desaturase (delta-12 desaturase)